MRQKRRAREALEQAIATFEALPAPLWADRAHVELGHIGGRAAAGSELTATERQVAELVAKGLTNREVASRLYVTPKTIEFHLRTRSGRPVSAYRRSSSAASASACSGRPAR